MPVPFLDDSLGWVLLFASVLILTCNHAVIHFLVRVKFRHWMRGALGLALGIIALVEILDFISIAEAAAVTAGLAVATLFLVFLTASRATQLAHAAPHGTTAELASPAFWSLEEFSNLGERWKQYGTDTRPTNKYPFKHLRYLFVRKLLEQHARELGRPLSVLEVGIDRGQMLAFMGGKERSPSVISRWDAIDVAPRPDLERIGYDSLRQMDVDRGTDPDLGRNYDAMIFLHVLEHLHEPEKTLKAFMRHLSPEGLVVGGSPTMPKFVADMGYAKYLASHAKPYGHVSVISPERLEIFAEENGHEVTFMSGAFLIRNHSGKIENSRLWAKFNLLYGSLFPSIGSEVYFTIRPGAAPANDRP